MRRSASEQQIHRRLSGLRDPQARHTVVVCMGKDCQEAGSDHLARVLERCDSCSRGIRVVKTKCLGCCGIAPAVAEDDRLMGRVTEQRLESELRRLD
jgi:NADH:ubiquinone oxidoreductase subunit E